MDNFVSHVGPLPRRMPSDLPVTSVGYIPRKRDWIRHAFDSFNFSFILSGGGSYRHGDFEFEVCGPCVITQWPGVHTEYGPGGAWESWEELYVIYPASVLPTLRARNLASPEKPAWLVRRTEELVEQIERLKACLPQAAEFGMADRIDRLCEAAALESRLGEHRPPMDRREAVVRAIRQELQESYRQMHDFDAIAQAHGLSPASFRRYWGRYMQMPPARYVMTLRLREACRLLVESEAPVAEIADHLGFGDALYFSRKFNAAQGMPPTAYRRRHDRPRG